MDFYSLIDNARGAIDVGGENTIINDFVRALVFGHFINYDPYLYGFYGEEGVVEEVKKSLAEGSLIPREIRKKELKVWHDPAFEIAVSKALNPSFWDQEAISEPFNTIVKAARLAMMEIGIDYMESSPNSFHRFCKMRDFEKAVYNGDMSDDETIEGLREAGYLK